MQELELPDPDRDRGYLLGERLSTAESGRIHAVLRKAARDLGNRPRIRRRRTGWALSAAAASIAGLAALAVFLLREPVAPALSDKPPIARAAANAPDVIVLEIVRTDIPDARPILLRVERSPEVSTPEEENDR